MHDWYYVEEQAAFVALAIAATRCRSAIHTLRGIVRYECHPAVIAECRADLAALWSTYRAARRRYALARFQFLTAYILGS